MKQKHGKIISWVKKKNNLKKQKNNFYAAKETEENWTTEKGYLCSSLDN